MKKAVISVLLGLSLSVLSMVAQAAEPKTYKAAIWIDPDGCEHWALDLGVEGMMSPHLDREGNPVCNRNANICMEFPGDVLFAVNKAELSGEAINQLKQYFTKEILDGTTVFLVTGHADNDGSALDNFDLSQARADAVANVGRSVGAVTRTDWFGESAPIATNDTEDGKRRNRRVEIYCE